MTARYKSRYEGHSVSKYTPGLRNKSNKGCAISLPKNI